MFPVLSTVLQQSRQENIVVMITVQLVTQTLNNVVVLVMVKLVMTIIVKVKVEFQTNLLKSEPTT